MRSEFPLARMRIGFRPREHMLPLFAVVLFVLMALALLWWTAPGMPLPPRAERVVEMVSIAPPPEITPEPEPEAQVRPEIAPDPMPVPADQPLAAKPIDRPAAPAAAVEPAPVPVAAPPSAATGGVDRAADVGADSFQLAAGKGGGLFGRGSGGGGGAGDWNAAVALHITRALQRDPRTRVAGGTVRVAVMIDPAGRFSQARFLSSTGNAALDGAIREVLARLAPMGRPRPPGVSGNTDLNIHLRRNDG